MKKIKNQFILGISALALTGSIFLSTPSRAYVEEPGDKAKLYEGSSGGMCCKGESTRKCYAADC